MSSGRPDPVDRALTRLAEDDALELPDPRLERRLLSVASERPSRALLRLATLPPWAAACLVALAVTGVGLGATVGVRALTRWWYTVSIDGHEIGELVDGEGSREYRYTTDDGVEVHVQVGRRALEGAGHETEIRIREEGQGTLDEELHQIHSAGSPTRPSNFDRLPVEALEGARVLHTWRGSDGSRQALYLAHEGASSRLLVHQVESTESLPVTEVLRAARPIARGGRVDIRELQAGALLVELSDGLGWQIEVQLAVQDDTGAPAGHPLPEELITPSGRVRVRVGD